MFICACGCGTHVYSTRTGPGHELRTPYRMGCTARVNTGACLLHFACVRAVRCSAWTVRAVVYLECVCVRQSACVARPVSFVQRFVCQRGQICLVCPTPCAVRLGVTGAEHTRPCWYLCWYLFRTLLCSVNPGNVSLARARTRTGTPLAQFAWVSRALYILARVGISCWYLFCTVLRLVSQTRANVPSLPYPLRSSLGYHGH